MKDIEKEIDKINKLKDKEFAKKLEIEKKIKEYDEKLKTLNDYLKEYKKLEQKQKELADSLANVLSKNNSKDVPKTVIVKHITGSAANKEVNDQTF